MRGWWCADGDVEGFWFPQTALLRAAAAGGVSHGAGDCLGALCESHKSRCFREGGGGGGGVEDSE